MTVNNRNDYGSQTPPMDKLSNGYLARISFMENQLRSSVDENKDAKFCPRCERTRYYKFFGTRVMREPKTGRPLKVIWQSYCTECRSAKPGQKPKTKKGAAAKQKVTRRVKKQVQAGDAAPVETPEAPVPVIIGSNEVSSPVEIPAPVMAAPEEVEPEAFEPPSAPVPEETVVEQAPPPELVAAVEALNALPVDEQPPAPMETVAAVVANLTAPPLGDDEYLTKCGERLPRGVICGCDECTGKA